MPSGLKCTLQRKPDHLRVQTRFATSQFKANRSIESGEEGINYILERFRFAASFNVFFKKLNNIKVDAEVSGFCK